MFKLIFLIKNFNLFLNESPFIIYNISTQIINMDYENLFINFCSFYNLLNSSIYLLNSNIINLLIENCLFYSCSNYGDGGAIYINSNTNIILNKICSYNCFSTLETIYSYGQFCFSSSKTNKNHNFYFCSIIKCSSNAGNSRTTTLRASGGNQIIKNINFSLNNVLYISAIQSIDSNSFYGLHCTLSNNNASFGQSLNFHNGINRTLIKFNLISNISPYQGVVYMYLNSVLIISDCIFIDNKNILFFNEQSILTIKNSFILHFYTLTSGIVSLSSNGAYKSSYIIDHYYTHLCYHETNLIPPSPTECFILTLNYCFSHLTNLLLINFLMILN